MTGIRRKRSIDETDEDVQLYKKPRLELVEQVYDREWVPSFLDDIKLYLPNIIPCENRHRNSSSESSYCPELEDDDDSIFEDHVSHHLTRIISEPTVPEGVYISEQDAAHLGRAEVKELMQKQQSSVEKREALRKPQTFGSTIIHNGRPAILVYGDGKDSWEGMVPIHLEGLDKDHERTIIEEVCALHFFYNLTIFDKARDIARGTCPFCYHPSCEEWIMKMEGMEFEWTCWFNNKVGEWVDGVVDRLGASLNEQELQVALSSLDENTLISFFAPFASAVGIVSAKQARGGLFGWMKTVVGNLADHVYKTRTRGGTYHCVGGIDMRGLDCGAPSFLLSQVPTEDILRRFLLDVRNMVSTGEECSDADVKKWLNDHSLLL